MTHDPARGPFLQHQRVDYRYRFRHFAGPARFPAGRASQTNKRQVRDARVFEAIDIDNRVIIVHGYQAGGTYHDPGSKPCSGRPYLYPASGYLDEAYPRPGAGDWSTRFDPGRGTQGA
jgi:hypothetical protein